MTDEPHDARAVLFLVVSVCGRRWALGDENRAAGEIALTVVRSRTWDRR